MCMLLGVLILKEYSNVAGMIIALRAVLLECRVSCHFVYMMQGSSTGGRGFDCAREKRLHSAHDMFRKS